MIFWSRRFDIIQPIKSFPQIHFIGNESWFSPTYRNEGKAKNNPGFVLFEYSLSGYGIFEYNGVKHKVEKGSGFFTISTDSNYKYYFPEEATESWEIIFCSIGGTKAIEMAKEIINQYGHIYSIPHDKGIIKRFLDFGSAENYKAIQMSASENSRLAIELMLSLVKSREVEVEKTQSNRIVAKAQQEIQNHIYENINVTELADLLDVSREHLSRIFSSQTGETLHSHISRQKIHIAAQLLKDSTFSIKEIAQRLGFENAVNFSRTFSRHTKMSPKDFRELGSLMEI